MLGNNEWRLQQHDQFTDGIVLIDNNICPAPHITSPHPLHITPPFPNHPTLSTSPHSLHLIPHYIAPPTPHHPTLHRPTHSTSHHSTYYHTSIQTNIFWDNKIMTIEPFNSDATIPDLMTTCDADTVCTVCVLVCCNSSISLCKPQLKGQDAPIVYVHTHYHCILQNKDRSLEQITAEDSFNNKMFWSVDLVNKWRSTDQNSLWLNRSAAVVFSSNCCINNDVQQWTSTLSMID